MPDTLHRVGIESSEITYLTNGRRRKRIATRRGSGHTELERRASWLVTRRDKKFKEVVSL